MSIGMYALWVVIMIGSLAQGVTGFGLAVFGLPALMLLMDPKSAVVMALLLNFLLSAGILLVSRKDVDLRYAIPLTIGSVLGVPLGVGLLLIIPSESLKILVILLVLIFLLPQILGFVKPIRRDQLLAWVVGGVSGVLQSATGLGTPPTALFLSNQGVTKDKYRAGMALRTTVSALFSIIVIAPSGIMTSTLLWKALAISPALIIGFVLGCYLSNRMPEVIFTRLTLLLVASAVLLNLIGSFKF